MKNGREPHDQEREHQHRLASDLVPVVAEDDAAERASEEADGKGAEGRQGADERVEGGEEQLVEDQRGSGAVEEEVIPLGSGPDEARQGYLPDRAVGVGCLAGLPVGVALHRLPSHQGPVVD